MIRRISVSALGILRFPRRLGLAGVSMLVSQARLQQVSSVNSGVEHESSSFHRAKPMWVLIADIKADLKTFGQSRALLHGAVVVTPVSKSDVVEGDWNLPSGNIRF